MIIRNTELFELFKSERSADPVPPIVIGDFGISGLFELFEL